MRVSRLFPRLDSFTQVSESEIEKIIMKGNSKSCALYPVPTFLVKQMLPQLLPSICKIVNKSLLEGKMSNALKEAILKPLLKKNNFGSWKPKKLPPRIKPSLHWQINRKSSYRSNLYTFVQIPPPWTTSICLHPEPQYRNGGRKGHQWHFACPGLPSMCLFGPPRP